MPQQSKDEDSSTTYATISAGNINIGGKETTVEALGIHSDINTANQKVNDLPDLQAVLDKQKIIADATSTIATAGRTYSQDQIKKAVQEKEALQGELKTQLSPEEQAKIKNYTIKQKDEYFAGNPEYAAALANEKTVTEKWGMGGDYSRGLNAVTTALTAVLGGQTDLQAATNTLAPYAAQVIGQQWGHGEDKNTAAQLAAHAILGATLAYINGGDPTAGGSAAVASEAAATYFTNQYKDKKEYQDANGVFQPNLLPEDVKTQIRDLTAGIGAVIGGAVGDSSYNAQLAGVIGQNAVENNNTAFMANPLEFEELKQPKTREEILLEAHAQKEQALYMALALNIVKDFILYRNLGGKYEVRDKATGKAIATFDNAKDAQKSIDFAKFKVEQSKQNKHILGTNEYKVSVSNDKTKSILSVDPNSLTKKLGTGQPVNKVQVGLPGSKERIDFGKVIGTYIDPKTGVQLPTSKGIVHYSNKGIHIVPSRP